MAKQRLYVVHGMGSDAVGLVGRITTPIAESKGNVLDLRQDVLHGLFTIYMVVDLTQSSLDVSAFEEQIADIGEETGLQMTVDQYSPVPRSPDKQNVLMIFVGKDKPGIISTSSAMLGKYNANIEFAQTIAREGIFVMELLTDVSHLTIPLENLERTISKDLQGLNIEASFQEDHVFIKRKRIILFHLKSSFISQPVLHEVLQQTGLDARDLASSLASGGPIAALHDAAAKLDGLPLDVVDTVLKAISPTAGSVELIQTLKVMGYKIVLASNSFSFVTDHLCKLLDIDAAYGIPHQVDDDSRVLLGELVTDEPGSHDIDGVVSHLRSMEDVGIDDITIINDDDCDETPGIRLDINLGILLNCYNQRVMSKQNLIGLLASFGVPNLD